MASIAPPPVSIPNLHLHELVPVALKPGPTRPPILQAKPADGRAEPRPDLFHDSLLEMSTSRPGRRFADFALSIVFHTVALTTLLLLPLYFTEKLDLTRFTATLLVVPPPPPPPPPAAPAMRVRTIPRPVFTSGGRLLAPTAIPQKVAMIKEEPLPPEVSIGVEGGVPGGVPGGQLGGVIGGVIAGAGRTYVPPAPAIETRKAPLRVGGHVRAPRKLSGQDPVYPLLALQAKIQGDVLIDAVLDADGRVSEMRVISGHPVLLKAALDAAGSWRYEPTYLNETPVPVQFTITVHFQLR